MTPNAFWYKHFIAAMAQRLLAILLMLFLLACSSASTGEEERIGVKLADMSPRGGRASDTIFYGVSIMNVSDQLIHVEWIGLDPLEGDMEFDPRVHTVNRLLEPGQGDQFRVFVTVRARADRADPQLTPPLMVRVSVSFRSGEQAFLRTFIESALRQ